MQPSIEVQGPHASTPTPVKAPAALTPLELFALVFDTLPDGVLVADLEGRFILSNRAAEELAGQKMGSSHPAQWSDRFGAFMADGHTPFPSEDLPLAKAMAGQSTDRVHVILKNAKTPGGVRLSVNGRPLLTAGGELIGGVVVYHDMTGRFEAEMGAIRLASVVSSSDDAIYLKSLDGTILAWNPAAERLYQWPASEAIGQNISVIVPPQLRGELAMAVARITRGERVEHKETTRVRRDGTTIEVLLSLSPIHGPNGAVVGTSGICRDITELKRARRAATELASDEGRRELFQRVPIGLFRIDAKGNVVDANPATVHILGFATIEELKHHGIGDLLAHPADIARWMALGLNSGAEQSMEFEVKRPGKSVFWARATVRAVLGPDGAVLRYDGSIEDITDREAANRLREEILAMVSHEFRTPITIIQGYAHLLTTGSLDGSMASKTLAKRNVDRAARRLTFLLTMVSELSALRAGRFEASLGKMATEEVVDEALAALEWTGKTAGHHITFDVGPGAETIVSDRRKLGLALTELLDNAVKFSPKGSPVAIRVFVRGDEAVFELDDEGPGLPPQVLGHMGRPFVQGDMTTKREQGGVGLGLAVVAAVAAGLGGCLEFEARSPQGTRARLIVGNRPPTAPAAESPAPFAHAAGLT